MTQLSRIFSLDLRLADASWTFAQENKARIAAHWTELQARKPHIWNGAVLICLSAAVTDGHLIARFAKTDYASFVAWRDWGWPDRTARNCFGSAAVLSRDGALIYGRMGRHTLNAGEIYPPGGSLEPADVQADGRVDIIGSIRRELAEETGLDPATARAGDCIVVFDGRKLSVAQAFHFDLTAPEIEAHVATHLAQVKEEELEGIAILRDASQTDSTMPGYAVEIAKYFLNITLPP